MLGGLNKGTLILIIILMLAAYTLRAFLYVKQANSILSRVAGMKNRWRIHAMGRGSYRFMKSVVLIGADEDHIIQEALVLKGITVFARMKPYAPLVGMTIEEISQATAKSTPPGGIGKCVWVSAGIAGRYAIAHMDDNRPDKKASEENACELDLIEANPSEA